MNLLSKQQSTSILKTITISKSAHFLFVYDKRQLTDIEKFCCDNQNNASILAIDTTFNLCDLWITDTTYRNQRLINPISKKNPVYLGPIMFRFTKEDGSFNRFALELLSSNPKLRKLQYRHGIRYIQWVLNNKFLD